MSYLKLPGLAEQAGDVAARLARLRDCYGVLSRMRSRNLHFDPPLQRVYDWRAQFLGNAPPA